MKVLTNLRIFIILFLFNGCTYTNDNNKIIKNPPENDKPELIKKESSADENKSMLFLSAKFPTTKPIAAIHNVKPYQNLTVPFSLIKDTKVFIHATGEGMNCLDVISSGDSDNIEFYFDMLNEKKKRYDENDRQYRFFWNWNKIEGNNFPTKGLQASQSDFPGKYTIELLFPWHTLGFVKPKENLEIGFDFAITDKDLNNKKKYAWFTSNDMNWDYPYLFGTMRLGKDLAQPVNKDYIFISLYTSVPPTIDSKKEKIWDTGVSYKPIKVIAESKSEKTFFNASIKSLWDEENLYFLVEVWDDQKQIPACDYLIWDYASIETPEGEVVWKMTPEKTKHAGGALKNLQCDTTISFKKGDYVLKYVSDENHAFNSWNDDPPTEPFYGVYVSEAPK